MITGTVSSKGQVTIPKKIREFLRVGASDKIVFIPLEDGKVLITTKPVPVSELFGMLSYKKKEKPVSVDDMKDAVRKKRAERAMR